MHIPDGFLTPNTWISAWLVSAGGIGYCLKKTAWILKDKMIPLMAVMSAFIFSAQMLNFPVMTGTSGHLLGAMLAAVFLGPYAAAVVLACVLIVQCLVFQDGGLTALGANILNMALIGSMPGYLVYRIVSKIISGNKGIILGAGMAAWFSVVLASAACSVELAVSQISPLRIVMPAMTGVHMLIGIGEAVITSLIVSFVLTVRPDLICGIGRKNNG